MPFENEVVVTKLIGNDIYKLIDYLRKVKRAHPISGLKLELDKNYELINAEINNKDIDIKKYYYVATSDFLLNGGDKMDFFNKSSENTFLNYKIRDLLIDYFIKIDTLTIVKPYQIFYKGGIKIGIFGLGIELDGMVTKNLYKETKYLNPVEITQEIVKTLKNDENCDLIICLSHLGFKHDNLPSKISDVKLAKATKDIDLIIGGHTHTFMKKPVVLDNLENKKVIINQVGCHGLFLGKIDFYFDSFKNKMYEGVSIEV